MADSEKRDYSSLSQKQYEEQMQKWHDDIKKKTQAMTMSRSRAWLGEPRDLPSPKVEEVAVPKKKGGKK